MAETPEPTLSNVLSIVKNKGYRLDFDLDVPSRFKGEPAVIEAILAHGSLSLEKLPAEALADRAVLLTIARGGGAFSEFPEWARDDDEIARVAVTQSRSSFTRDAAFEAASARLRGDRAFVLLAFSHGARYDAVKHIADDRLTEDLEILKLAVKAHGQSFGYIPEKLRSHPELIGVLLAGKLHSVSCFDVLPASYRDDVEIAVKAIDSEASCFQHLSERLRDDDALAERALRASGRLLVYASPRIRDDKRIVLIALEHGGDVHGVLRAASPRLREDRDVGVLAMRRDARAFELLGASLREDPEVIRACMAEREYFSGHSYKHFPEAVRADRAVALRMSEGRDFSFEAVPSSLQRDREIVRNAIKSQASNIEKIPEDFVADVSFLKELVKLNDGVLYHLPDAVKNRLFSARVRSIEHRGRVVSCDLVLDDGYVQDQQRAALGAQVQERGETILKMGAFPLIVYEDDGPVGSYLSARYVNNVVLCGDFLFFVRRNSGKETFTRSLSRATDYGPDPQPNDDFLKHEVFLLSDDGAEIAYEGLSRSPRIYFGRAPSLPRGVVLFEDEGSYRVAATTLKQDRSWGEPQFVRVDEQTLERASGPVDQIEGAARVYVDGAGWRFLIPNPAGPLRALEVLRATTDAHDWEWIKPRVSGLSDAQRALVREHFAGSAVAADVRAATG